MNSSSAISTVLRTLNPKNSIVPDIFIPMEIAEEIELLSYVKNGKTGMIFSTIKFNEYVERTLRATNKANLFPFDSYELTPSGHIRFIKNPIGLNHFTRRASENLQRSINPASMAHVNSRNRGKDEPKPFTVDRMKLAANDRDEGEY